MQLEIFMAIGYLLMSSSIGLALFNSYLSYKGFRDGKAKTYLVGLSAILMCLGAFSTFLHLGNKVNVFYILTQIQHSWLTRESWMIGLFIILAFVTLIVGLRNRDKQNNNIENILSTSLSVVGICLIIFMSFAYMTVTSIPAWGNATVLITNVAESILLGFSIGLLVVSCVSEFDKKLMRSALSALTATIVLALIAFIINVFSVTSLPDKAFVLNNQVILFAAIRVITLLIALIISLFITRVNEYKNTLVIILAIVIILVIASDYASRVLHFISATHTPLIF